MGSDFYLHFYFLLVGFYFLLLVGFDIFLLVGFYFLLLVGFDIFLLVGSVVFTQAPFSGRPRQLGNDPCHPVHNIYRS